MINETLHKHAIVDIEEQVGIIVAQFSQSAPTTNRGTEMFKGTGRQTVRALYEKAAFKICVNAGMMKDEQCNRRETNLSINVLAEHPID